MNEKERHLIAVLVARVDRLEQLVFAMFERRNAHGLAEQLGTDLHAENRVPVEWPEPMIERMDKALDMVNENRKPTNGGDDE